jgi:hypothetical protein
MAILISRLRLPFLLPRLRGLLWIDDWILSRKNSTWCRGDRFLVLAPMLPGVVAMPLPWLLPWYLRDWLVGIGDPVSHLRRLAQSFTIIMFTFATATIGE